MVPSDAAPDRMYFEDLAPGMTFGSPTIQVTRDAIVRFAAEFDPQPFHLDEDAAQASFFGTLVASGWHTAALTMQLLNVSELAIAGGLIGGGGEIKWPAALRPDDSIHLEIVVREGRRLRSRDDVGIVTVRTATVNQRGAVVQELIANMLVPVRTAASTAVP